MKSLDFDSSRWKLVNNLLIICVALYGFATQNYKKDEPSFFQKLLIELIAPIQTGSVSVKETISNTFDHYIKIVNTSKENVELRDKLSTLENQIFNLSEVEKENLRLKQLLEFGREIPKKKVLAQIVSWDASNKFKVLRINKGSSDGLKVEAPVITMTGLVGYVHRVSANYADILTILDENNRVDSIVSRTRTHGIVEGYSGFNCLLKYISRTEVLELGDVIITAGFGVIYPKGIKVGTVSKIDKENFGITQRVEVKPSVDFHRLEEVVVLIEDESARVVENTNHEESQK